MIVKKDIFLSNNKEKFQKHNVLLWASLEDRCNFPLVRNTNVIVQAVPRRKHNISWVHNGLKREVCD